MTTKKQFTLMYEQTVDLLKTFKQSNDRLNKSIGVQNDSTIALKLRSQQYSYNNTLKRLNELVQKLQQSYLDPDTARKIGTVKQQFRIQKDRRAHLMQSVQMENLEINEQRQASSNQLNNNSHYQNNQNQKYQQNNNKVRSPNRQQQKNNNFQSQITDYTIHNTISSSKVQQEELIGYDYQIQCKLMSQKSRAINQVQKSLLNVYSITQQTSQMVHQQGQNIDIIGDEIFDAYKNVRGGNQNLQQANQNQRRAKGKYAVISVLLILAIIAVFGIFVL